MPPPWATNPAPRTESAREARKAFHCDLCQKGYSRITEFEAHEGSYDHQHKKRLKEMKSLTRDPTATARARRAEEKATKGEGGGFSIKPIAFSTSGSGGGGSGSGTTSAAGGSGGGGGGGKISGFKKGGFRNAFGGGGVSAPETVPAPVAVGDERDGDGKDESSGIDLGDGGTVGEADGEEREWERWGDYDPRRPTECGEGCYG